jgi:hypothetical protein
MRPGTLTLTTRRVCMIQLGVPPFGRHCQIIIFVSREVFNLDWKNVLTVRAAPLLSGSFTIERSADKGSSSSFEMIIGIPAPARPGHPRTSKIRKEICNVNNTYCKGEGGIGQLERAQIQTLVGGRGRGWFFHGYLIPLYI